MFIDWGLASRTGKSAARNCALIIPRNITRAWQVLVLALVLPVAGWTEESQQRLPTHGLCGGNNKIYTFLTNHFDLPALTICALYRQRWQIELFFKWIKQHLWLATDC